MDYKCKSCGYEWNRRIRGDVKSFFPSNCRNCKSNTWDIGDNVKCWACDKTMFRPIIHHIDGNHSNNESKNRLPLCGRGHRAIHMGVRSKAPKAGNGNSRRCMVLIKDIELENKLWMLREMWLKGVNEYAMSN